MPNLTTNFNFNKPLVNDPVDEDLWGGQLNDNWDSVDSILPVPAASKFGAVVVQSTDDASYEILSSQGTSGQVLTSAGGDALPTWQTPTNGTVTSITVSAGTGLSGGGTVTTSGTVTLNLSTNTQEQLCKAWVSFDGTGTLSINDSFNVTSVTDNGTGNYTVNFTTNFANANYCAVCLGRDTNDAVQQAIVSPFLSDTKSTSAFEVHTSIATSGIVDLPEVNIAFYGDQ